MNLAPRAGALCKLLKPFEDFKINLNRIESRPSNKGEYAFEMALDFNGDIHSANVQVAVLPCCVPRDARTKLYIRCGDSGLLGLPHALLHAPLSY